MNEGDALLREILLHPNDLDLRLIYADWLEDHGETNRAELIRVQIELGRWKPYEEIAYGDRLCADAAGTLIPEKSVAAKARYLYLTRRELELMKLQEDTTPLAKCTHWRNGFITTVSASILDFMRGLDTWFLHHPVEAVEIIDRQVDPDLVRDGLCGFTHQSDQSFLQEYPYSTFSLPRSLWEIVDNLHHPHHRDGTPPDRYLSLNQAALLYGQQRRTEVWNIR